MRDQFVLLQNRDRIRLKSPEYRHFYELAKFSKFCYSVGVFYD